MALLEYLLGASFCNTSGDDDDDDDDYMTNIGFLWMTLMEMVSALA
jgi:hypothetical protein